MWKTVIAAIDWSSNDCNECDEGDCIEYPNNAAIIEYAPNDPNTGQPTSVEGYPHPPWYRIIEGLIGGIERGDIISDLTTLMPIGFEDWFTWLTQLPALISTSGLPRFRVRFSGAGTVELHLLQVPQGGFALIQVDGLLHRIEMVSLQSVSVGSVVSATYIVQLLLGIGTGEVDITPDIIHEIVIEEQGEHFIDVTLIPNITLELTDAGWGGGLRKVVLCGFDQVVQPCEECEPRTDGDKLIEDFMDEIGVLDPEEFIEMIKCGMPFVGQIVAGLVPPSSTAWLKLDGTEVNKVDYAALWQALEGTVTDTETTFFLPNFVDRLPMGAGTVATLGGTAGTDGITLAPDNLPTHSHTILAHTHTTEAHTHTQNAHTHTQDAHTHTQNSHNHGQIAHNHTQDAHTHTQNAHTHTLNDAGHNHDFSVRQTSAVGAQAQVTASNNSGAAATHNTTTDTTGITAQNATATNQNATATNQAQEAVNIQETATNQNATATNQNTTATNQSTTVTVNEAEAAETGEVGDFESFPIIPPVIGVHWYIFSGCVGEDC